MYIFYVNVLSSTDEAVQRRRPYSKLCETSRHCLMFTQTLSSTTRNIYTGIDKILLNDNLHFKEILEKTTTNCTTARTYGLSYGDIWA